MLSCARSRAHVCIYPQDMLSGLQACHGACVVHRDVKGDNFLAVPDSSPLGFRVKLCDFGFASFVGSPDASDLSGVCGTAQLMAPEIVANEARRRGGPAGARPKSTGTSGGLLRRALFRTAAAKSGRGAATT